MKLGAKQRLFSKLIAQLILWAYKEGYEITMGDVFRSPRAFGPMGTKKAYGRASSNHKLKLAADLNLFKNGKYLSTTKAHKALGEKWESMDDLCCWGGRFNDGNHYSLKHNGNR